MHALVTGAGGFLGRYIVEALLDRGDHVRGFARGEYPELASLGVEMRRGDLRDGAALLDACSGIDCVFHVASHVGVWGRWKDYYQTNVVGTQNVIDACRKQGVRRLVFTSSPSVTFEGGDQCGVDESVPYAQRWLAHYPHSKALAEQAVLKANDGDGFQTCALRPHLIWGPRDHHLIARLIARARAKKLRRVGKGTNRVDITYVENGADAHLLAADALEANHSPVGGKAYFLSQGEPVNCWEWIDEVLALKGLPPVEKSISQGAAWRVGAAFEGAWKLLRIQKEPPMTRFVAAQLATSHWFNLSAAQRDFGYKPRVSTAEGMQRLGIWLNGDQPSSAPGG